MIEFVLHDLALFNSTLHSTRVLILRKILSSQCNQKIMFGTRFAYDMLCVDGVRTMYNAYEKCAFMFCLTYRFFPESTYTRTNVEVLSCSICSFLLLIFNPITPEHFQNRQSSQFFQKQIRIFYVFQEWTYDVSTFLHTKISIRSHQYHCHFQSYFLTYLYHCGRLFKNRLIR